MAVGRVGVGDVNDAWHGRRGLGARLLPFDGSGGLIRDVENDPVDAVDLGGDPFRDLSQQVVREAVPIGAHRVFTRDRADRKSTRLNSSHVAISYAVFCLK